MMADRKQSTKKDMVLSKPGARRYLLKSSGKIQKKDTALREDLRFFEIEIEIEEFRCAAERALAGAKLWKRGVFSETKLNC
jgi:hypothetical protein